MPHTGMSRSAVCPDHALITEESHVPIRLPGWPDTESVVLVSGEMGAKFAQYLVSCTSTSSLTALADDMEYLVLVLDGTVSVEAAGAGGTLPTGSYAFLPAATDWVVAPEGPARLLVFEKCYVPGAGGKRPEAFTRALADVPALPFLGDEAALLQTLLPDAPEFDWGINVFEFVPGATLPQVESHFMEHGLYLLDGQGVYRLGECWYPVQAGDAIWMAPYLMQWFAATGKTNTRYIYYKEMNRVPGR